MNDDALPGIGSPEAKYGSVGKSADGRSFVLFERRLAHSIDAVWAAINDPEQRAVWAAGIQFESKKNGEWRIWFGDDCEGPSHASGTLTEYDPPRVVQLGSIRFELEEVGDGCVLRFSDVLWFDEKRTKTDFTNDVLGGWHRFLDKYEYFLDQGQVDDFVSPEPDYSRIEVPGRE